MSTERPSAGQPGDPVVERAWRKASSDEPPASVDAAILAAARAATARTEHETGTAPGPRPQAARGNQPPAAHRWWTQWQPLAAAAGVTGLAFVLLQMQSGESGRPPSSPPSATTLDGDAPAADLANSGAPEASLRSVEPSPSAPGVVVSQESAGQPADVQAKVGAEARAGARSEATEIPMSPGSPGSSQSSSGSAPSLLPESSAAAPARMSPAMDAARTKAAGPVAGTRAAADWLQQIEALKNADDEPAALAALQEFRRQYPDADERLPPGLREWAAGIAPSSPLVEP